MDSEQEELGVSLGPLTKRKGHGRYRTLFDLAPIAVYSCDGSGVIQEYNNHAAELWGRKPAPGDTDERFCGSFKMYRPDGSYMPHEQCPMGDVLSGKVPGTHDAEVLIERPDGSRVIVIVNIAPLTDEDGEIIGAINCFYDVTERKALERDPEQRYQSAEALGSALSRWIANHGRLVTERDIAVVVTDCLGRAIAERSGPCSVTRQSMIS